jgi:hypothetical protein
MTTQTKNLGAPRTEGELLQPSRWKLEAGATVFFGDRQDDRRLTWTVGFYDDKGKWWDAKISIGPNGRFDRKSWCERAARPFRGSSISWERAARAIWFAAHPEGLEKVRAERRRRAAESGEPMPGEDADAFSEIAF